MISEEEKVKLLGKKILVIKEDGNIIGHVRLVGEFFLMIETNDNVHYVPYSRIKNIKIKDD